MKRDSLLSSALLTFGIAVLLYVVVYSAIERRRSSKGPWQVAFTQGESGVPTILINQHTIGITNVQVAFTGAKYNITNGPVTLTFNEARRTPFDLPYGKCVFLDTVFLPGTVVIETFGHQIQLMPRVLTIDGVEYAWKPVEILRLTATNSPSVTK